MQSNVNFKDLTDLEFDVAFSTLTEKKSWAKINKFTKETAEFFNEDIEIDIQENTNINRNTVKLILDWDNKMVVEMFNK